MLRTTPKSRRLEYKLLEQLARASATYRLLEPGDRVMVAVSGGKDSHVLLHLLRLIQKRAPFSFELLAVHIDQGQPGYDATVMPRYFEELGYEYRIVHDDTYSIVKEKSPEGKSYCSLCSRLRRGILYTQAKALGMTKIALGHHRDDLAETLLLNIFYSGQLKTMPARLRSDDGQNVVIRPLIFAAEEDIAAYATEVGFPILPCSLCGSQPNLKRKELKIWLRALSATNPAVSGNILAALANVRPSHLLDLELQHRLGIVEAQDEPELPLDEGLVPKTRLTRG